MDIATIEQKRRQAGIQQKVLCEKAGVNVSTYSQLKKGHRGGYAATLQKLDAAADQALAEKGTQA